MPQKRWSFFVHVWTGHRINIAITRPIPKMEQPVEYKIKKDREGLR
jgi:hypothetical protein